MRIGYVRLIDAAPLIVAEELGAFAAAGLQVRLTCELGWGSIRDKLAYGELDAAHAPGGLLFSLLVGTHAPPKPVWTDLVMNFQGNGVTLSRRLWEKGGRDQATFRMMVRSESPARPVLAAVSAYSSHPYLLREWLRQAKVDPDREVRMAILPPALVEEHMREGQIDGFCVGEPWNSIAAFSGSGWVVSTSCDLSPGHPEKVLVANEELRNGRRDEYRALLRVVSDACAFCDKAANRKEVVDILARRKIFGIGKDVIANSLIGPFRSGGEQEPMTRSLMRFASKGHGAATPQAASWFYDAMTDVGVAPSDPAVRRRCLSAFGDVEPASQKTGVFT